jgi:hypothetical protein
VPYYWNLPEPRAKLIMKRLNRLNEIEKFWKCKDRDMQWDQILDEHFTGARCFSNSKRLKDVENDLQGDGYSFW